MAFNSLPNWKSTWLLLVDSDFQDAGWLEALSCFSMSAGWELAEFKEALSADIVKARWIQLFWSARHRVRWSGIQS